MIINSVNDVDIDLYPRNEIDQLFSRMIVIGEVIDIYGETLLSPHLTNCFYFLMEGAIEIVQPPRVLGVILRPFPIGILELYQPAVLTHLQYKVKNFCKVLVLSKSQWDSIVQDAALRESVVTILSYAFHMLNAYHRAVAADTHYRAIRALIYLYDKKKEHFTQEQESLLRYIVNRTSFSKSHILKILAELKRGNYITLKKGCLISINRTLPMDF